MSGEVINENFVPATEWSAAIIPIINAGHDLKIPLKGMSMSPLLIGDRDEAVISTIIGKQLRRGDIVLYVRSDGTHVLHRIHHIKKDEYYMLGDAQTLIEGPLSSKDILAVAVALNRKGRKIKCNKLWYRVTVEIWLLLRPIRPKVMDFVINVFSALKRFRCK